MEKIKNPISKKLPPLVLYLDDIQELYELLKKVAKKTVVIETCNYRFSTLEELSKLREEKANAIVIKCDEPFLSIELHESWGLIFVSKINTGDIEAEGIFTSIEKILLLRKKSIIFSIASKYYLGSFLLGFSLNGFRLSYINSNNSSLFLFVFLALSVISAFWTVFGVWLSRRSYNTLFFKLRKESPSFWERNKDQIIVGIVTAVITAIISAFVTVLITTKVTTKTNSVSESNSQKEIVQKDVNSH